MTTTVEHRIPNGCGWELSLFQTWDDASLVRGRRPVLIVPGYGMNSFIFSFHPRGLSLQGYLARAGFEVWRVDLRGQGSSSWTGPAGSPGRERYGLEDLTLTDLTAAVAAVRERSRAGQAGEASEAPRVDVLGASLGGTIMFAHAVLRPDHGLGTLVAIGSPVRWVEIHPALRVAFSSPALAGAIRFTGTRRLAGLALPLLARRLPWVLSVYMNAEITDTSAAAEMVRTVEDPNRHVNRQIAHWIRARDLVLQGVNVSEGLRAIRAPLLCVSAYSDGIVPRATAAFPCQAVASPVKKLIEVGGPDLAMAHADLFISDEAEARVFEPVAAFLREQNGGPFGLRGG